MIMEDTIAAISTSTMSSGGISVIRISCDEAVNIASKIFKSAKSDDKEYLKKVKSHTVHYGYIEDDGVRIDEVLLIIMKAPNTYTREDVI